MKNSQNISENKKSQKTINCELCDVLVFCGEHGTKGIEKVEDPDSQPCYVCYDCVEEYHTAFGAILHWCSDIMGLFG